jgi:hypothetical protein
VVDRDPKVNESLLGTSPEDAQGTGKMKAPPLRFSPPANLVDDDLIGGQFLRQQNCIAFAGVEVGQDRVGRSRWCKDFQPGWRLGDPRSHCFRRS